MRTTTFLLGITLAIVSCGHSNPDGYTITGKVKNCGEWADGGHIVLVSHYNGKRISDTATITKGHFTLSGHIANPDFVGLAPVQTDKNRPMGRILFFLENEKYTIKIEDGHLSGNTIKGGTSNKLFKELSEYQRKMDEKYSIESIDRQLNTTSTPPYRMEKLRIVRNEYDSVMKAFKDSIVLANTPSYFGLFITAQEIVDGQDPSLIKQALAPYLKDDKYKDDPRLKDMIERTEEKRRP